ncbi:hypothetical protein BDY17DRAFT_34826 [Neohortaea acidophila]|uniref:Uncharacterized protein n=1 Tax=Neohortaea acidophila TaxID=245834 RepID=A0A6A6PJR6_9PEZI|nr:uncharacterized protein BDY17DRAFT_34826 [Neohortaea acidophila]KAF2480242.1 hypothetical protein BDY17DRAFT_34826 [Neohortaea acidophila]
MSAKSTGGEVMLELLKRDGFSLFFVCDYSIRRCATGRGYGKRTGGSWSFAAHLVRDPPKLIRSSGRVLPFVFQPSHDPSSQRVAFRVDIVNLGQRQHDRRLWLTKLFRSAGVSEHTATVFWDRRRKTLTASEPTADRNHRVSHHVSYLSPAGSSQQPPCPYCRNSKTPLRHREAGSHLRRARGTNRLDRYRRHASRCAGRPYGATRSAQHAARTGLFPLNHRSAEPARLRPLRCLRSRAPQLSPSLTRTCRIAPTSPSSICNASSAMQSPNASSMNLSLALSRIPRHPVCLPRM